MRGEIAKLYQAVIARSVSDEAIQLSFCRSMDCFASLAMTAWKRIGGTLACKMAGEGFCT
jgi:hypothetical protein